MATAIHHVQALLEGPRPLPIIRAGDPVLRRRGDDYDWSLPADLWAELIEAMRETMLTAPGVGLAAPQVGLGLRFAVIEDSALVDPDIARARDRQPLPFRVIVNPQYTPVGDRQNAFYEGCLSVPGYQAVTVRSHQVRLTGQDGNGAALDEVLSGWAARIVAHETDHLDGTLYLDRAEPRSLASTEAYLTRWAGPTVAAAAAELGFGLPG